MSDDMDFYVQAADLRLQAEAAEETLEQLAKKLELTLPHLTTVTRGGWFFTKEKPVTELVVSFDEQRFQIVREGKHVKPRVMKAVRGVVLNTRDVSLEEWTEGLANQLNRLAQNNEQARKALAKLSRV
ncbi:MAG TPA: hypothetical protein V6D47_00455 [Oscillatoriaceae cyanobacterium]